MNSLKRTLEYCAVAASAKLLAEYRLALSAHLSMSLGDDGQKLSKRLGAVSVMQYDDEGYLP